MEDSERQKAYHAAYYQTNRERLNEARRVRVECGCGKVYTKRNVRKHRNTEEHVTWLKEKIADSPTIITLYLCKVIMSDIQNRENNTQT